MLAVDCWLLVFVFASVFMVYIFLLDCILLLFFIANKLPVQDQGGPYSVFIFQESASTAQVVARSDLNVSLLVATSAYGGLHLSDLSMTLDLDSVFII